MRAIEIYAKNKIRDYLLGTYSVLAPRQPPLASVVIVIGIVVVINLDSTIGVAVVDTLAPSGGACANVLVCYFQLNLT